MLDGRAHHNSHGDSAIDSAIATIQSQGPEAHASSRSRSVSDGEDSIAECPGGGEGTKRE